MWPTPRLCGPACGAQVPPAGQEGRQASASWLLRARPQTTPSTMSGALPAGPATVEPQVDFAGASSRWFSATTAASSASWCCKIARLGATRVRSSK